MQSHHPFPPSLSMKPLSCSRLLTAGLVLSGVAFAQGDECATATAITPGTPAGFDTSTATPSVPAFTASCSAGGGSTSSNDVWFSFTATADYAASATTCGTAAYDTKIEVYSGSCGALVSEGCNDDAAGCLGFTSRADFAAVSGTEYFVRIGGWSTTDAGGGQVLVTAPPSVVSNDECAGAINLPSGSPRFFDTTSATFSSSAPARSCGGAADPIDVWYRLTALDSGPASVSTCSTASFDTTLEVYTGTCGALLSEVCNDDGAGCAGFTSRADFTATAGNTYYVRVMGYNGGTGTGTLVATYPDLAANDDCSGAFPIELGETFYSNVGATDSLVGMGCVIAGQLSDVWFSYTARGDCPVAVDLSGSSYDTGVAVWQGDCAVLTQVECDDDSGFGLTSSVSFNATAGTTYYIQVGGFNGASGDGVINLNEGIGSIVCPGNANSTGVGAVLRACGSLAVADNDTTLEVSGLPQNKNVLFVNSRETILVANPGGSQGNLCIGSLALGRHVNDIVDSGLAGTVSLALDLANVPTNLGRTAVVAGETWYWQAWYRDIEGGGAATSNLSSAVGVTFN